MSSFIWMSFKLLSGMRSRKLVTGAGTSWGWCKAQVAFHHPTSSFYANWYLQNDSCNTCKRYGLAWFSAPCRRSISEVSLVKSHDIPWRVTMGSTIKRPPAFGQRRGSTQAKQCRNGIQVAIPPSKWELHVRSDLGTFSFPSGSAMHATCVVPKLRTE